MIYKINITHDEESDSLDALFERVSIAAMDIANLPFTLAFEMPNYKREFV